MSETNIIPKGLKITFLVHFILGLVMGIPFLLFPEGYADMLNFTISEPMAYRMLGAATIGFSISSWLAYKKSNWDSVEILVIAEIIWTILGTIITIWGIISEEFPAAAWLNAIPMLGFAIAFCYFFFTKK
jgi:hypothetical protein